ALKAISSRSRSSRIGTSRDATCAVIVATTAVDALRPAPPSAPSLPVNSHDAARRQRQRTSYDEGNERYRPHLHTTCMPSVGFRRLSLLLLLPSRGSRTQLRAMRSGGQRLRPPHPRGRGR
ncbi:hypothetical protein Vretifemale_11451, partial [Volvox reticuliferus]